MYVKWDTQLPHPQPLFIHFNIVSCPGIIGFLAQNQIHFGCFRESSLELKGFSRLLALGWSQSFLEDSGETLFLDLLAGQSTALPIPSLWHTSAEGQDSCFLLHEAPICIIHGFDPTGRQERGLHRAWGLWLPSTTPCVCPVSPPKK